MNRTPARLMVALLLAVTAVMAIVPSADAKRKASLQEWYGLDDALVRVVAPDVGGGFGPKIGAYPEEMLLGWLAGRTGRPPTPSARPRRATPT